MQFNIFPSSTQMPHLRLLRFISIFTQTDDRNSVSRTLFIKKMMLNYIKISSRGMEVRKKGQVNTHMVFEQGKRNMAFYTTPFGTLEMGISATNLELEESDGQIAMKVNYSLDLNQEHVADCCLDIQAQGKNTTGFVL